MSTDSDRSEAWRKSQYDILHKKIDRLEHERDGARKAISSMYRQSAKELYRKYWDKEQ